MIRSIFFVAILVFLWAGSVKAQDYKTVPEGFPSWSVTGERDDYLFIAPINFGQCSKDNYLIIIDGKGELVYQKRLPDCQFVTDFKPQPDGTLSYWTGYQLIPGVFYGELVRIDSAYQPVSVITETNLLLDGHEYLVLPNGHQVVMYGAVVTADQSASTIPAGPARMIAIILRELDSHLNTVWEWNSIDYIPVADADDLYLGDELSDYMHTNAIEMDTDGNLLISSRHLNEITKIERETGEILWRLGGKENEFTLANDDRWFSHQHDIRRLPNGNISLFDNGNHLDPEYSRYVEYQIDEDRLIVTKTREIRHSPDVYGMAMGSARQLPNGHVLIGWGANSKPAVSEYDAAGAVTFELSLPAGEFTYRAYSGAWESAPNIKPTVAITDGHLYYSVNGATNVAEYRVYAGSAQPTTLIDTQPKTGFEDSTRLKPGLCVYQVKAIGTWGTVVSTSDFVADPGCNRVHFPIIAGGKK